MPDLLATVQIAAPSGAPLRAAPVSQPVSLPGTAAIAGDFGAALGELLLPGATPKGKPARQPLAETGKDLPDAADPDDALIAWSPEGMMPLALPAIDPAPALAAVAATGGTVAPATALPAPLMPAAAPGDPAGAPPLPVVGETVSGVAASLPIATPPRMAEAQAAPAIAPPVGEAKETIAPRERFDALARDSARASTPAMIALQPTSPSSTSVASGAAAQVFANALTAAPTGNAAAERASDTAILLHGHARTEQLATVQAMSGASQAPLDMHRDDWTGQMIERIAQFRDAADAADTRIKLAPENLGALEVSIRRDGDRIHVHFAAENPAARQLIADAAPRLAELADARGLKLGQTSVDAGSQQGGQRDAPQPHAGAPLRNPSSAARAETLDDERIA